jgi:hypothetical protein
VTEFVYEPTGRIVYVSELWVCPVCLAITYYLDKGAHTGWHRTLTNRPREEGA